MVVNVRYPRTLQRYPIETTDRVAWRIQMQDNMGPTEQKIRMAVGSAAAASAIFAPLAYKWKGLLTATAFLGLFTGATGFSPFKRIFGLR